MEKAFTKTPKEVCSYFGVNPITGLTKDQVLTFQTKYGKNELSKVKPKPLWTFILAQLKNTGVLILLSTTFSLSILNSQEKNALIETCIIFFIVFINALIRALQQKSTEKSIETSTAYSINQTKVVRQDGTLFKILAHALVPGDIIYITAGDKIPADARILEIYTNEFRVIELTGDSVLKSVDATQQEQINMVFSGTCCIVGKARAIVVATGSNTALGSRSNENLKGQLNRFSRWVYAFVLSTCALTWAVSFNQTYLRISPHWTPEPFFYFKMFVVLAIVSIPQNFVSVMITCLAHGTKKIAKQGAIVRHVSSVDALGRTTVICSNKTNLTTNQMCVSRVSFIKSGNGQMNDLLIEGNGYSPNGTVKLSGRNYPFASYKSRTVKELATVCSLCNDARVSFTSDTYQYVGEPMEAALQTLVEKLGTNDSGVNGILETLTETQRVSACNDYFKSEYDKKATLEFSQDRQSMSVIVSDTSGKTSLLVKGAPESILERCSMVRMGDNMKPSPLTHEMRKNIDGKLKEFGNLGLRCLAIAKVEEIQLESIDINDQSKFIQYESDLVFIGLIGMTDPPHEETKESIKHFKTAGIRVIVMTGDNKNTAEYVSRQIGLFHPEEDLTGKSFTGREYDALSKLEKMNAIMEASLFSRIEPRHKQEIVGILQSLNEVVGVVGDSINDALVLKKADIGIAMESSKDVTKLAADIVLSNGSFATVEKVVEEGRTIYDNTKQIIRYLVSSNIGEVFSIFIAVLLDIPKIFAPVQLLWVKIITDTLPAMALGFSLTDPDIMRRKPRNSNDPLVRPWLIARYLIIGVYIACAIVYGNVWWYMYSEGGPQITLYQLVNYKKCAELFPEIGCNMFTNENSLKATTMSLSVLIVIKLLNAMNSLSETVSLTRFPASSNPYLVAAVVVSMGLHLLILHVPFLANIFSVVPLTKEEWVGVLHVASPIALYEEILKYITNTLIDPPTTVDKLGDIILYDFRKNKVEKEE